MQVQAIYKNGRFTLPDNIELQDGQFHVQIDLPSEAIRKVSMKSTSPLKDLLARYPDDEWLLKLKKLDEKNRDVPEKDLPRLTERQLDNIEAFAAYKEC